MDLRETLSTFEGFIGRGEIDGFCELKRKLFLRRKAMNSYRLFVSKNDSLEFTGVFGLLRKKIRFQKI